MSEPSPNITMKPEPRPSLLHRNPDATDNLGSGSMDTFA